MKKTLAFIFALCLCLGMCACGANSEPAASAKSTEAQKADELILAIGEVSLEKESAVLAAKAYYDTLTDDQKSQVENSSVLDAAIITLDTLKDEEEYKAIYDKALEYEQNLLVADAYAEYEKLPSDYQDVKFRMQALYDLTLFIGTWTCESNTAVSSNGDQLGAPAKAYNFTLKEFNHNDNGVHISIDIIATNNDATYTNSSIFKSHFDTWTKFKDDSYSIYVVKTEDGFKMPWYNDDGNIELTGGTIHSSKMGDMEITYTFTSDGKLNVEFCLNKDGNTTTVVHTYTKQ